MQKAKLPLEATSELGYVGTEIFSGYIQEDYQEAWRDLKTRCETVEKMIWGNSTVGALLEAIKAPILSSTQSIEPWSKEEKYQEHAEFIRKNFFEYIDWQDTHVQLLSYIEYGFSVQEIVYEVKDGMICLKRLAPRIQSSIEKWSIVNKPWVDGHPAGITQSYIYGDEVEGEASLTLREIPWDKLLIFSNRRRGNNYEGESILRRAYSPYFYLDLIQKIAGISVERYGVGLPYAKVKGGNGSTDNAKLEELLRNIRSNEQAFALINENVTEFKILTPEGSGAQNTLLEKLLLFYDRKLYDSVLAGFLNLTAGEGGSNALSKDQSSFFMRSLQSYTKYIEGRMNQLAEKLIRLNFGDQEGYPCFKYSDIGQISMDEFTSSLATAKNASMITWGKNDEATIRAQLGLPEMEDSVLEMYEKQNEARENEEVTVDTEKEKEIDPDANKEDKKKENDDEKEEMASLAEITPTILAKREKEFVKNISDYENYLESEFANIVYKVSVKENMIRKKLESIYLSADTEMKDGKKILASSGKNTALKNEAISYVRDMTKKLKGELVGSAIQNRLFDTSQRMAIKTMKADRVFFDSKRINSIVDGYNSNVMAILFNDPRRMEEQIVLNFGSQVAQQEAITQALEIEFNRNILKLSTLTHPRQAFNAILNEQAINEGFTFFKGVIPKSKLKDMAPTGLTSKLLYNIYTEAQLTDIVNGLGTKTNVSPLFGMNIHHGGYMSFLPIASLYLALEMQRAKEQREKLQESLDVEEETPVQ